GKVSSNVYGGRINVTVESTSDTSIIEAMLNSQFKAVDATITFKKTDEDTKLKTAEIVNAYIVYYKESLNVNGEEPMTINFTLSAEKITIGN
ncbi:type VI secretion system needle protein Hcp, partial [Aquimarina celericrescens]|nr:type VI secretion system needle protein Hcp [Aquimarina celericrescens]